MIAKKSTANASISAVGVTCSTPSIIILPTLVPAPASNPKTIGNAISAATADIRFVMISVMNVTTIASPRNAGFRRGAVFNVVRLGRRRGWEQESLATNAGRQG